MNESKTQFPPIIKTSPKPFLKWAGGKRRLLEQYRLAFAALPPFQRYIEPFVGSGAVFFWLRWHPSFLYDMNPELIEVYEVVRDDVEALLEALAKHTNTAEHYYHIRAQAPHQLSKIERAARFIYLNKTCYNGLYRVNRKGQFNVPFGRYKNPNFRDPDTLKAASAALQGVQLGVCDFEQATAHAQAGDLIYFDPPYAPLSKTADFTGYTRDGFSENDQRRLAEVFFTLHERGCYLIMSNSYAPLILELYHDLRAYRYEIIARRAINTIATKRGPIKELLITNFVVPELPPVPSKIESTQSVEG